MTEEKTHVTKQEIQFPNGNCAYAVTSPPDAPAEAILKALEIQRPQALIVIAGGASDMDKAPDPRLVQLFSRGIAQAAAEAGAMIVDGGTQAGVMAMMGQGVADRGRRSSLVGVAPAGKVVYPGGPCEKKSEDRVPLDPNHSHFVLVESDEWGGETEILFDISKALAMEIPVLTILVNGGDVAQNEALLNVRQGWPMVVIEGSGRIADEIANLMRKKIQWMKEKKKPLFIEDTFMAEIVHDGDIQIFPPDGSIDELKRLILQQLPVNMCSTLKLAWERFALYDHNAKSQQATFNTLQIWILTLGVLATLLALITSKLVGESVPLKFLKYAVIITPITISTLVAAANRFKPGSKWVLLRAGAEAIKREIYRYRTRAQIGCAKEAEAITREEELVRKIEEISFTIMQTEVNQASLRPYEGEVPPCMKGVISADDGFSFLTPQRYIDVRLGDQISFYQKMTIKLNRKLKFLQWLIYIFGGLGTLLAAVGLQIWIALTTAFVGAFSTYLEYQQVENTLTKYNQTATDLNNIKAWWTALPEREQRSQNTIDRLVGQTEKVLQSEMTGWAQQMEDALAELRAKRTGENDEENG